MQKHPARVTVTPPGNIDRKRRALGSEIVQRKAHLRRLRGFRGRAETVTGRRVVDREEVFASQFAVSRLTGLPTAVAQVYSAQAM